MPSSGRGAPEATADAVARGVRRRRRLRDRGDRPARGDGGRVPLDARARSRGAHRHPARRTPCYPLPALTIPRMERRVLGSIYGSPGPSATSRDSLDLYRRGRLPLDRLDLRTGCRSKRPSEAFELMHAGDALRVVLELEISTSSTGGSARAGAARRRTASHVNVVLARRGSPTAAAAISMLAHPAPGAHASPRLRRARRSRSTSPSGRRR